MTTNNQNKKYYSLILLSFILSFFIGALSFFLIDRHRAVNPDSILDQVKSSFRKEGPIEGSWIEMTKVPWSKHALETEVYYGGLSRVEEGKIKHYEFLADAYTGSLLDIYEI